VYEVKSGTVCGKAGRDAEQETSTEVYGAFGGEDDGSEQYEDGEG